MPVVDWFEVVRRRAYVLAEEAAKDNQEPRALVLSRKEWTNFFRDIPPEYLSNHMTRCADEGCVPFYGVLICRENAPRQDAGDAASLEV